MARFQPIATRYRTIVSPIPHPRSKALLRDLNRIEPRSMSGMPPVVWHRAEGFQLRDPYGNRWIDFSSAVILANAGHSHPFIGREIRRQLDARLWQCYCNPSETRRRVLRALHSVLPRYLDKIFLLTTGSEATECALKLARMNGRRQNPEKYHILSFEHSFHGRTMGSQAAGGYFDQQTWMGKRPQGYHHVPFPHSEKDTFADTLKRLRAEVDPRLIAGVITETFQGPTVAFMPRRYARELRRWADRNGTVVIFDEIQAGFGRTGRWFGFEHCGIRPDLVALGKGLTSSLPMSAVAGRKAILDLPGPGEMSSSHTGNPLCAAAAIGNIEAIRRGRLVERARRMEPVVRRALQGLRRRFPGRVGEIPGRGLVWAVYLTDPATGKLDPAFGKAVTSRCLERGLFLMQTGRGTLKIAPPLVISEAAFLEGVEVIAEAIEHCEVGPDRRAGRNRR